jgi:lipopolysaccharide transport system ATP-binding protein
MTGRAVMENLVREDHSVDSRQSLLTLMGVSKVYRLWHKPHERLLYGVLNSVPAYAPEGLRKAAATRKAKLGQEVFALQEVSLKIEKGRSVGIIGRNGSGKSTLLQLIAGVLQPTSGRISVATKRITALLELGSSFDPNFTGRENVLLHGAVLDLPEAENKARLAEVLDFSEIGDYFDQPVRTYSSGMIVRLAFSSAITVRPELLVVDEALAVGDIFFQQRCFRKIRELMKQGVTILVASHDMRSVSEFCEESLLLHHGRVAFFGDSNMAISQYYGLTQFERLLTTKNSPVGAQGAKDSVSDGLSSSDIVLEPVKTMHPSRDAAARFLGFAVLDEEGKQTAFFRQGEWLTVIYDIAVRADIENLCCGIIIHDDHGVYLHGKYLFQADVLKLRHVHAGERLRATISFRLDVGAGNYTLSLDLISVPEAAFKGRQLAFADFDLQHQRVCGTGAVFAFSVGFNSGHLGSEFSHFGLFDLPTRMDLESLDR